MAGVVLLLQCGIVSAQAPVVGGEGVPVPVVLGEGGGAVPVVEATTPTPCCAPSLSGAYGVLAGGGGCATGGCGENGCYPGRDACCSTNCEGMGPIRRTFATFRNALLCPDPCYQSKWVPAANAGLFVDQARPTTMTRLRWDAGRNVTRPDRSDYFFGSGAFPGNPVPRRVDYNELHLYQEIAIEKFGLFFDLPYRNLNTDVRGGAGGIGDLSFGTKTMFLDSELLSMTFQFRTTVPTGNATRGVGTGSVSLEPSILTTMKLFTDTYMQSQTAYWFALGNGNGSILISRNSLNTVLYRPDDCTALIGSFETGMYTLTSGRFRDPNTGLMAGRNGDTYFTLGPGFRLAVGDKLDLGFGMQFALTRDHFADQLYRTELRWRF
jgi:hypothetical protein